MMKKNNSQQPEDLSARREVSGTRFKWSSEVSAHNDSFPVDIKQGASG